HGLDGDPGTEGLHIAQAVRQPVVETAGREAHGLVAVGHRLVPFDSAHPGETDPARRPISLNGYLGCLLRLLDKNEPGRGKGPLMSGHPAPKGRTAQAASGSATDSKAAQRAAERPPAARSSAGVPISATRP